MTKPFLVRAKDAWRRAVGDSTPPGPATGLSNPFTAMGTTRDQTAQTYFDYPRFFGKWELENAYRSSWIAKRIVNLPANDMTREWRSFTIPEDDGEQVKEVEQAEKELQVKKRVNQSLKWARLYGGCLLFMGIGDEDPSQPLNINTVKQGDLKYLLPIDRWHVSYQSTGGLIYNVADPRFGTPEFYTILGSAEPWHFSRVIRFDGEELPLDLWLANMYWADSTLNHVLTVVLGFGAAQNASLLAMQQGSLDIVSVPGLRDNIKMNQSMDGIINRVRIFSDLKSIYRCAVKDSDENFDRVAASITGYDKLFERFQDEVCGACEIPHTVLYGQSPAGLRATGDFDTRHWYDSVATRQENDLRPQLDYLDQVLIRHALGEMPEDYNFDFVSLWQNDEETDADIKFKQAQTDHIYVTDGVLEPEMVTRELLHEKTYETLTEDDVELIESFNEPMQQEPELQQQPAPGVPDDTAPQNTRGNQTRTTNGASRR